MQEEKYQQTAINFGHFLDQDDFVSFKSILDEKCIYEINDEILKGKDNIAGLYETNMKAGKAKFDKLEWGKSEIKEVESNVFDVHFSDNLLHKGIQHNYRCKQRITINANCLVEKIVHMELPGERESLNAYYL